MRHTCSAVRDRAIVHNIALAHFGAVTYLLPMFGLFKQRPDPPDAIDYHVAFGALLVRLARVDSHYHQTEIELIETLLMERFDMDQSQARELRDTSEKEEKTASDTVRFTKAIKSAVPYEARIDLVRDLWRVVLADDSRDMQEDGLMRLVVNLLGVNDRDSALARHSVSK